MEEMHFLKVLNLSGVSLIHIIAHKKNFFRGNYHVCYFYMYNCMYYRLTLEHVLSLTVASATQSGSHTALRQFGYPIQPI
jgi:hypothetical protein